MLSQADFPPLSADCAHCAALCCVALTFEAGDHFAFDKPAGRPCPHLCPDNTCGIHKDLSDKGFDGCIAYDCAGAGQRVVQEILTGESWRNGEAAMSDMLFAFAAMRAVHEALQLIRSAASLDLPDPVAGELAALATPFLPESWTFDSLKAFDVAKHRKALDAFLPDLAPYARR